MNFRLSSASNQVKVKRSLKYKQKGARRKHNKRNTNQM